jgi:pimeloyl-ACP methyl ester carboxylesterase
MSEITFGLVHGAWHGAWCWGKVEDELREAGHRSVAVDLPIDDPEATFDDHADIVAAALKDHENIVLVGHSRGANVVPRVAAKIAVSRMIFLCGTFYDSLPEDIAHTATDAPVSISAAFAAGILPADQGLFGYNSSMGRDIFYHDCAIEDADWAIGQLRPQRRAPEQRMEAWPKVPTDSILCRDDRIVNPEWSRFAAKHWLGVEPVELPGGHSPFLSRPEVLAAALVALAEQAP